MSNSTKYWWVNLNQTYRHEVPGGYMWSPKVAINGARIHFWDNMTLVTPGDIVFAFADKKIKAVGIIAGIAQSATKPKVFGKIGENWSEDGWFVPVEYTRIENPIEPKNHMHLIGPMLNDKYNPIKLNGDGNQNYLSSISDDLGHLLLQLSNAELPTLVVTHLEDLKFSEEEQEIVSLESIPETERATLVLARRGQGTFRARVKIIESRCRVTGVSAENLLIASHIKPWKESDNLERLDGNNGLFLSPHVDKLFDSGFITFTQKGELLVSPQLDITVLEKWSLDPLRKYGKFNDDQAYFLEFHGKSKFRAA